MKLAHLSKAEVVDMGADMAVASGAVAAVIVGTEILPLIFLMAQ